MKVIINSNDNFILFFNKLNDKLYLNDNYEEEFKNIFLRLKNYYRINIYGFYNIFVYKDKHYGTILKVEKDKELDLFYKQIDMHIVIEDNTFLYKVDDYFFINDLSDYNIYYYNDNFYLEIINKISNNELFTLIENSTIIFGEETDIIKNKGKLLKSK